MRIIWGIFGLLLIQQVHAGFAPGESRHLACRGDTYTSTTGESQTISRFNTRRVVLTVTGEHTDLAYEDGRPIRAVKTESAFRARTSDDPRNWQLIHLDYASLDISVTTFTSLPDHRHRSVRFKGSCEIAKPMS